MKNSKVRALAESAVLIALAFALSWVKFELPYGGSVTAVSMLPILLIGIRRGLFWGLSSSLVYAFLQILQSFYPPPVASPANFFLVVFLDYFVAFGVLGLSALFRRFNKAILVAVPSCLLLRFLSHFFSGILIWGVYAWDGWNVWPYSFAYNGSYMGIEIIFTFIAAFALFKTVPSFFSPQD